MLVVDAACLFDALVGNTVRGWDAMYVALAEALGAVLLTGDRRLAAATGPTCRLETTGG